MLSHREGTQYFRVGLGVGAFGVEGSPAISTVVPVVLGHLSV